MSKETASSKVTYPINPELIPDRELVEGRYALRFAKSTEDLDAVLRLRFEVFNLELGEGLDSSIDSGRDLDEFDPVCHHLMVTETATAELVGCYRMQTSEMAAANRGFYSNIEFDLASFPDQVVANALETGRACVHRDHRSTLVLFLLWKGLALYVANNRKRFLFGCSSLPTQDPHRAQAFVEYLAKHDHLHSDLWVETRPGFECFAGDFKASPGQRVKVPPLFRTYLRHGAKVCSPPAIDRQFKTIDFLVLFDVDAMDQKTFQTFFE